MTTAAEPGSEQPLTAAQQRMVVDYGHIPKRVARRFANQTRGLTERDELEQAASLALVKAARSFRIDVGVPFSAYASRMCHGALMHVVRDTSKDKLRARRLTATCLELQQVRTDLFAGDDGQARAEAALHVQRATTAVFVGLLHAGAASLDGRPMGADGDATRQRLADALAALDPIEAQIVAGLYFEGHKLKHVAASLGLSYDNVLRRHDAALDRLRVLLDDEAM